MIIIIQLVILIFCLYIIWLFLYSLFFGAPYAAIGEKRLNAMLRLVHIKKGERAADLGSGDGRIVVALSEKGALADGYEINPLLYLFSKYLISKSGKLNAYIYLKDLWKADLSEYAVITLYGNFPMMKRLEKKLQSELKPGARVLSNHFQFPTWKAEKVEDDVYLYIKH